MAEIEIADDLVIDASASTVWAAIKDPDVHASWHPFVTAIEGEHALGGSRSCSVMVGKKSGTTLERCIDEEHDQRIIWAIERDSTGFSRMVSDWRAGFRLEAEGAATRVTAVSSFRPKFVLRVMSPIVKRKFHQAQRAILAGLKASIEDATS